MDVLLLIVTVTLGTLRLTLALEGGTAGVCGQPGRPINGTVTGGSTSTHSPGDRVSYSCVEGFVLFGDQHRTCLTNGSWDGEVPLCDFNISAGKRSLQSGTLWSYTPDLAVDGSPETCSFTPRGPDPRWWQVHLGHKFNVIRVAVTISPGSLQEFTIYVIELLADNKALYKPCTTFKGVFQTQKADFLCNDGLGHPGQFVYIRDDREEEEYFGLCEVQVFAFRERIPCGSPGVPLHGRVAVVGDRQAQYTCDPGYTLTGDATHTCSSRGKWEGQEPRCVGVRCSELLPPVDGEVAVQSSSGSQGVSPGTVASYSCRGGFSLQGNRTRACLPTGEWEGEPPSCIRVSCGEPPSIVGARHTLLNASDVHRGIAVYTCLPGFRLTNVSSEMVSTCQDSGTWKEINITCVPEPTNKLPWDVAAEFIENRSGSGRALNYDVDAAIIAASYPNDLDSDNDSISNALETPLVTVLAVVASLLLIALLIVLAIVAVRRHYLSGPGSLNPLLRSMGHKNSAFEPGHADNGSTVAHVGRDRLYNDSMNNGNRTPMSSLYHHNLLRGSIQPNGHHDNGIHEQTSLSGSLNRLDEPPYERVRTRSEHSYETIRKLSQHHSSTQPHDVDEDEAPYYQVEPSYERLAGDKGSLWYESVDKASVGYETVPEDGRYRQPTKPSCDDCINAEETKVPCALHKQKDPGYEKIRDHQYETLKEKDPGYESLKDKSDAGYDTMTGNSSLLHGYETVPPKPGYTPVDDPSHIVPDILQDIEVSENPASVLDTSNIPPEILALYAQVDKSKKKKKEVNEGSSDGEPIIKTNTSADGKTSIILSINSNNSSESIGDLRKCSTDSSSSLCKSDAESRKLSIASSYSDTSASNRPTPPPRPKGIAPQPPDQSSLPHTPLTHTSSDSSFVRMSKQFNDECQASRPPSVASECTSPSGTLRPLPPIPRQ